MAKRTSEEFEGYRDGDITYCVDAATDEFFPIKVVKVGRRFIDVEALNAVQAMQVAREFSSEEKNRRFLRPKLPPRARFGGFDERTVNAERASGQELRLLPYHYNTTTGDKIKKRHLTNPELWPLPTGVVFKRWFKEAAG